MSESGEISVNDYKYFLYEIGSRLKDYALETKKESLENVISNDEVFIRGRLLACHDVISIIKNDALVSNIPWEVLNLQDIDPDIDLT